MKTTSQTNYTPYQLKLPLELSTVIETTDAVYTFCEVIDHIDLNRYIVKERSNTGRPKYDEEILSTHQNMRRKQNSYSKTDRDATFMREKKDYMGNDQLLPGYNVQLALCDEYIAAYDMR